MTYQQSAEASRDRRHGAPHDGSGRGGPDRGGSDRGRSAERPSDIPRRGWRDILLRVKDDLSRDNVSLISAGVAFYGLLALSPALVALVTLYGLMFDPNSIQSQVDSMQGVLPADAAKLIGEQLKSVASSSNSKLGIGLAVSVLIALWSARSGTATLMSALNIAYKEEEKRGLIRFQLDALALTAGAIVFAVIALALVAVLPAILGVLPFGGAAKTIAAYLRWPILLALVVVALAMAYRFGPSRDQPQWRWVSWGAATAAVLWIVGSALFSIYVGQFAAYNKTYGSLGAVVVLLMWFYVTAFSIMLGAELNAEMEHQTGRDTTRGKPEPMGDRDAKMADTVGEEK